MGSDLILKWDLYIHHSVSLIKYWLPGAWFHYGNNSRNMFILQFITQSLFCSCTSVGVEPTRLKIASGPGDVRRLFAKLNNSHFLTQSHYPTTQWTHSMLWLRPHSSDLALSSGWWSGWGWGEEWADPKSLPHSSLVTLKPQLPEFSLQW